MNETKMKIVLGAALVLLLLAVGFIIKQQWDGNQQRKALSQQVVEMKQLQDGVVRSQSKYLTKKDFDDFAKDMDIDLETIQDDLDNFNADIKGLNKIVASSKGIRVTGIGSSNTSPRPKNPNNPPQLPTCPDGTVCKDQFGYLTNSQMLGLHEPFNDFNVPLGSIKFEAWKSKPWSINIHSRKYVVSTVLGQDENGKHYVHNRFKIGVSGKEYIIPIEQSEFVEKVPEASFRFDPHFSLGLAVGITVATSSLNPNEPKVRTEVQPTLDISFMSYSETKVNPQWKFLGVGFGYETQNNDFAIVVNPVDYNVGKHIPAMDNLYLGPTVGVDLGGQIFVGGGIRVGL